MLIGMLKTRQLYNPARRPELTLQRRNVVIEQMRKAGCITQQEADSLKQTPLEIDFNRLSHIDVPAPYFRQYLGMVMMANKPDRRDYPATWQRQQFIEDSIAWETNPLYGWCHKNKKADGSDYNIYTDGLKIYSTIDSRMKIC